MANLNRANLITESSTLFPDNNTQEISPADLRSWLADGTASFVTQKDKSTLENAIFEAKATTLASAATVDLNTATGNYLHISGTATINSFGTCPAGARFILMFQGIATLTYNATSLIIPGLANKTTAAGDCCMIVSEGSGNWRIVGYFAISGGGGGGGITALTGDVTASGTGSVTATIANGAVDIAMLSATGTPSATTFLRGDNTWATPAGGGGGSGGGASVNYYLNGSVSQGTFGGVACKEINRTPIFGAGTDFTINANGYIQSFITDANDPNQLLIPPGNWIFENYFSASSGGGSPSFYPELYKWDGTSLTLIASNSATPEAITGGTSIDLYVTALAVPSTVLAATDRLVVRFYVTHSGRTITMHTEGVHLSKIVTTFSTGITSINGLTDQTQVFTTGTSGSDFSINSATNTHTFNIPDASDTARGLITTGNQTLKGVKTFGNGTSAGEIRLLEPSGSGTNSVGIKAQAMTPNYDITLPANAGTSGYVLQTDGSGLTSWVRNGGGSNASYFLDTTETTVTGTTAETINKTLLIPANTYSAQTAFKIIARIRKDNQGFNNTTIRFYIGTNPASISGTLIGSSAFGATGGTTGQIIERSLLVISATQTSYNNNGTLQTDVTSGLMSLANIDWTVSQYLIITTQSNNNAYSAFVRAIQIIPQ